MRDFGRFVSQLKRVHVRNCLRDIVWVSHTWRAHAHARRLRAHTHTPSLQANTVIIERTHTQTTIMQNRENLIAFYALAGY